MSLYDKNLVMIQELQPELYEAIIQKGYEVDDSVFFVEKAKNGTPIFVMEIDGKRVYLSSKYDPETEIDRYIRKFDHVFDYSVIVFFGLGNGSVAEKMIKQKGNHIKYLIYEPSPKLFSLVLGMYDLSFLLNNSRVSLIVRGLNDGGIDGALAKLINAQNYKIALYHTLPVYAKLFGELEKEISQKFTEIVRWTATNVNTSKKFNSLLAYNDIMNMKVLFHCNCEGQFSGIFPTDRPAIIVGAGPSLEKNVEYLKQAKGRMLILATDSALPFLCVREIIPDMVFTVDSSKPPQLFEQEEMTRIPLAIITSANHEIVSRMKGKIIFFSADCDYYNKLFQIAGNKLYTIPNGGNVATAAFHMAIAWGYHKVVLVGQDLAVADKKLHAGDADERLGVSNKAFPVIETEGYYGERVYTTLDFDTYRKYYERIIRNDEDLEVINATEGGVKIVGATQKTMKQVIEECNVEPFDFERTIKEMPLVFDARQREDIIRIWEESVKNINIIKDKLHEGIQLLRDGIVLLSSVKNYSTEIEMIQEAIRDIVQQCDAMSEIYFLDEMVLKDQADILGDIYISKEDNVEEVQRIFEKMLNYIKKMHGAADDVICLFERLIKEGREDRIDIY